MTRQTIGLGLLAAAAMLYAWSRSFDGQGPEAGVMGAVVEVGSLLATAAGFVVLFLDLVNRKGKP